jgi:hypothetical protein
LAGVFELGGVCDRSHKGGGGERADAVELSEPLANGIGAV